MKKIAISIITVLTLSMMSCKKEYTCECSITRTNGNITVTSDDGKYVFNDSRTRAESRCNNEEKSGEDGLGSYTRDCEIK